MNNDIYLPLALKDLHMLENEQAPQENMEIPFDSEVTGV